MNNLKKQIGANMLIHIGLHKTGSSWLQKHLFTSNNSSFISVSDNESGRSTLAHYFVRDENNLFLSPFDLNTSVIEKKFSEIRLNLAKNGEIYVLSDEALSGFVHGGNQNALPIAGRLHSFFPNARVLIVIRKQSDFLFSCYYQYLKNGGCQSLYSYLHKDYRKRDHFNVSTLNFNLIVEKYMSLYGKQNVIVLPYEMLKRTPGTFIIALGDRLGSSIETNSCQFKDKVNVTQNIFVKYYLRWFFIFGYNPFWSFSNILFNVHVRRVVRRIRMLCERIKFSFFDDYLRKKQMSMIHGVIGDRFELSNKELSKLIGIDLSEYGYHK